MDFKRKDVIINRFNDAIKYIAEMQKAIFDENRPKEIELKRNAGEALSCAYEWSVKYHLFFHAENIPQDWKDCDFFREHPQIRWGDLIYALRDRNKARSFSTRLPNFNTLYDDKKDGRNISTHSGKEPIEENIISFSQEVRKLILAYVDNNAILNNIEDFLEDFNATAWESLYISCNKFQQEDTNYILLVGDIRNQSTAYKKYLGSLPWNLIIDFDQNSRETDGFFKDAFSSNPIQPKIINITNRDLGLDFFPIAPQSHFHYFIKGYLDDGANIDPNTKWGSWNQRGGLGDNFQKAISAFASKYFSNTKVVVFHEDISFTGGVCNILNQVFGDRIEFSICSKNTRLFERIVEEDGNNGQHIPITISELANGIALHQKEFEVQNYFENTYRLPHDKNTKTSGVDGLFTADEMASFEEDMEVLHLDILKGAKEEDRIDFLNGKLPLSWYGASLKDSFDVMHPKQKGILKNIEKGEKRIYYIQHEPGVGGTTLVRRLAWELHDENPVVILKDYRDGRRIVKKIEEIFDKTRKRVYIVANVPQSISVDDLPELKRLLEANTRTFSIIAVGRNLPKSDEKLTHWGDNCIGLINEFKKHLPQLGYNAATITKKEAALDSIYNGKTPDEKTPFYIGFLVSEENFYGLDAYIKNFVDAIKLNPQQQQIIKYLALVQEYLNERLPSVFFSKLMKTSSKRLFESDLTSLLPTDFDHVLTKTVDNNIKFWTLKHPLFAKKFKEILLRGNSERKDAWQDNLPELCKEFIEDSNISGEQSHHIQEKILQPLFIGNRKQRADGSKEAFTDIVLQMNEDARESVFVKLAETYPDNAHYHSHLARFYAYTKKNSEKALEYADKAIRLNDQDALLFHIRGMCYRQELYRKIDDIKEASKSNRPFFSEQVDEILYDLAPKAAKEFQTARKLQKYSEYGYVAHIQMLIKLIDFGHSLTKQSKAEFLSSEKEPYSEWLDEAATLLEEVKRLTIGEDGIDNQYVNDCDDELKAFVDKYDVVIQYLNNQLEKTQNPERLRRRIVRYMMENQRNFGKNQDSIRRMMDLMAVNIKNEPDKEGNFYLWFQAARHSNMKILDAIDIMARWKMLSTSLDASYYFYVLKVIGAIEGSSEEMADAVKLIAESKQKARSLSNNTYCHEWYGLNHEMRRLVSGRDVKGGLHDDRCELVRGIVTNWANYGDGEITIRNANQLKVFFNPSETKITEDYLNQEVEFYLGFSYDGLRAKNVQRYGTTQRKKQFTTGQNSVEEVAKMVSNKNEKVGLQKPEPKFVHLKNEEKKSVPNNHAANFKIFNGQIKIKNFSDGYIKCPELDKDIAFGRANLQGCDMKDIEVGTEVEVRIEVKNKILKTSTNGRNYKASEIRLVSK